MALPAAGFFAELAFFFTGFDGLAAAFFAFGRATFFAELLEGVLECFFFAELAINLGGALGLPGASGGLLKSISSGAQGEIYPLKTSKKPTGFEGFYELALE